MKVELISYTPDALNLLLRTKGTRLSHNDDPAKWSAKKKQEHLDYMRDTIQSSWEFVDYVFSISEVTRAFTHQIVRTRTGSYAQEAMRVIDARDHDVIMPETVAGDLGASAMWDATKKYILGGYGTLIDKGIPAQDARGILPTNISTSICAKFNLRTLSDTGKLRLCTRVQGEYQRVFRDMRKLVVEVHPWADEFIQVHCVALGTCAFPRYGKKECQHYDPRMDLDALKAETKAKFWAKPIQEAAPIAKDGKAM